MSDDKPFRPIVSVSEMRRLAVTNPQHLVLEYSALKIQYGLLRLKQTRLSSENLDILQLVKEAYSYANSLPVTFRAWKRWMKRVDKLIEKLEDKDG